MLHKRVIWGWLSIMLASIVGLTGCGGTKTKSYSAGSSITASTNTSSYDFLYWDGGMRVMLVYTQAYTQQDCESTMAFNTPGGTNYCRMSFSDGTVVVWRISTNDGQIAELVMNETSYQLSNSENLLIIQPQQGAIEVKQHQRDLTDISLNNAGVEDWLKAEPLTAPIIFPEE